jgi:hypothetical protein
VRLPVPARARSHVCMCSAARSKLLLASATLWVPYKVTSGREQQPPQGCSNETGYQRRHTMCTTQRTDATDSDFGARGQLLDTTLLNCAPGHRSVHKHTALSPSRAQGAQHDGKGRCRHRFRTVWATTCARQKHPAAHMEGFPHAAKHQKWSALTRPWHCV